MSVVTWQVDCPQPQDTEAIAEKLGQALKGGEVIELVSDLGGGKTTFVRGLAHGFGSKDRVASPTFTISRMYQAGNRTMHHFDFYRLPEPGLMKAELADVLEDPHDIVVVEWPGIVQDILPADRLTITIEHIKNGRRLSFRAPEALSYMVEAAK